MSPGVVLKSTEFGVVVLNHSGEDVTVQKFTWTTEAGLKLSVLNLDAAIIELCAPDRNSLLTENILLGVDNLSQYLKLDPALVCAARFEHPSRLHSTKHTEGESIRIDRERIWLSFVDGTRLQLSLEQRVKNQSSLIIATVTISVEPSNVVRIQYHTTSASGGLYRLAHRFLLNLAGREAGPGGTYEHVVQLNSDSYIDSNRFVHPASENLADMRIAQHLGLTLYNARNERCGTAGTQLDGIYSMNNTPLGQERFAVRLIHTGSGRAMELYCDFPWLRFSTLSELPTGHDELVPFYPSQGLRRLSLVFDIERFVVNVVDAIEEGPRENVAQTGKRCAGQDEHSSKDNRTSLQDTDVQERFSRNAGLLIHPLGCPFKIKRAEKASPSVPFVGHVTLKFGLCKELTNVRPHALRQINHSGGQ